MKTNYIRFPYSAVFGFAAGLSASYFFYKRRSAPIVPPTASYNEWDEVDEGSWESFPASDPPATSQPR